MLTLEPESLRFKAYQEVANIYVQKGRCDQSPQLPFIDEPIYLCIYQSSEKAHLLLASVRKEYVPIFRFADLTLAPHRSKSFCVATCAI